jgi:hypothetical protein
MLQVGTRVGRGTDAVVVSVSDGLATCRCDCGQEHQLPEQWVQGSLDAGRRTVCRSCWGKIKAYVNDTEYHRPKHHKSRRMPRATRDGQPLNFDWMDDGCECPTIANPRLYRRSKAAA